MGKVQDPPPTYSPSLKLVPPGTTTAATNARHMGWTSANTRSNVLGPTALCCHYMGCCTDNPGHTSPTQGSPLSPTRLANHSFKYGDRDILLHFEVVSRLQFRRDLETTRYLTHILLTVYSPFQKNNVLNWISINYFCCSQCWSQLLKPKSKLH